MKRENRQRKSGKLAKKAGQWFNPEIENDFKKIALQRGTVTPSQVGLELLLMKPDEKSMLVDQNPNKQTAPPSTKSKGQPQQGRPKNSKDGGKRTRKPKPLGSKADLLNMMTWAYSAQSKISDIINPLMLSYYNKKNMRSLSDTEFNEVEHIKFVALCCLEPHARISKSRIAGIFEHSPGLSRDISMTLDQMCDRFKVRELRDPTVDELRQIRSSVYTLCKENLDV